MKKAIKKLTSVFLSLMLAVPAYAGTWEGNYATGWYYNEDGAYATNCWKNISGIWYYFDSTSKMVTGWQYIGSSWYYFDTSGAMQTGWLNTDNGKNVYYLDASSGYMYTGWHTIDNKSYYFNSSGALTPSWIINQGKIYYQNPENQSAGYYKGIHTIDNHTYFFDPQNAIMRFGWQNVQENSPLIPNGWQYFNNKKFKPSGYVYEDNCWKYYQPTTSPIGAWSNNHEHEKNTIKGIDVSVYQGNLTKENWQTIKNQGIEFAIIRIGHAKNGGPIDKYCLQNLKNANDVGIKCGIYYYSLAESEQDAIQTAQYIISNISGYNISYPIAIDLEDSSQQHLGKEKITKIARAFCDEISAAGYTPMIYCNEEWYKYNVDFSQLSDIYKWIAVYNEKHNSSLQKDIWQSGSSCVLPGITANYVDTDFSYVDFSKIVTPRTNALPSYLIATGVWNYDSIGYKYIYLNKTYPISEWVYINNHYYYFDQNGYMTTGWQFINGYWYCFANSGEMLTGWQLINNHWYYFTSSGNMVTGWQFINNNWYLFSTSGDMLTGWQLVNGYWYFLASSGNMVTGWQFINNNWYLFSNSGDMLTGWQLVNGSWYYLTNSGNMVTAWQFVNNSWYLFSNSGDMLTGWQYLNNHWYYLANGGNMLTGWQYIGNQWYFLSSSGEMLTGWQYIGNTWYYFYNNGSMAHDTYIDCYYLNSSGAWVF